MNIYLMNAVLVKAPLFEQAAIPKIENDAVPFATRGLNPCLTGVLLELSAAGHIISPSTCLKKSCS